MINRIFSPRDYVHDLAVLLLRLVFGGFFVYYGYTKIISYDQILPMFGDIIGIGVKLSFNLVIFAEFFCGILIVLGFATRLAIVPIAITMAVAYFVAHEKDPFVMKQLPLVYLLLSPVIFLFGSGKFSMDYLIVRNRNPAKQ